MNSSCWVCKKPVEPDHRFCWNCGASNAPNDLVDAHIQSRVDELIRQRFDDARAKDQRIVEIEVSEQIAKRVHTWLKWVGGIAGAVFGTASVILIAAFAAIGFFGYDTKDKIESALARSVEMDAKTAETKRRNDEATKRISDLEQQTKPILGNVSHSGNGLKANDQPLDAKGPSQLAFWTPSDKTKEATDVKDWEKMDGEAKLDQFASRICGIGLITGYRHYDVTGAGIGGKKSGTWWVTTTSRSFDLQVFFKTYGQFWNTGEDSVYLELQSAVSEYAPNTQAAPSSDVARRGCALGEGKPQ